MGLLWPLRSQFTKLRSFSRGPEVALGGALFGNKEEKQLFGWDRARNLQGRLLCLPHRPSDLSKLKGSAFPSGPDRMQGWRQA